MSTITRLAKWTVRTVAASLGLAVRRTPGPNLVVWPKAGSPLLQHLSGLEGLIFEELLARTLLDLKISHVLDVGANRGQYGHLLRRIGYSGSILSFEPQADSFAELLKTASGDPTWTAHRYALGATEGSADLNVYGRSDFSSLLPMTSYGRDRFSRFLGCQSRERVTVRTLESVCNELLPADPVPTVFLKTDTQGYDMEVLAGLGRSLDRVAALQCEIGVLPVYEGTIGLVGSLGRCYEMGFALVALRPLARDHSLEVVEFDCLMLKKGR